MKLPIMKSFSVKSTVAIIFLVSQLAYATTKGYNKSSESSISSSSSRGLLIPVEKGADYRMVLEGDGRRRSLAGFQLCLTCKCCAAGGDPTNCTNMPCCFGINCDLPNKPFGVCSFVPNACDCTTCTTTTTSTSSQLNLQHP